MKSIERELPVYLRAIELEDYELINKWRNDHEVNRLTTGRRFYVSTEVDKEWIEKNIRRRDTEMYWAVCLDENDHMIGYIGVTNINRVKRSAV